MNKNPFVSQPSYAPHQHPLPPGPPPIPGGQPDYGAYWAAAAAQQQGHTAVPPAVGAAYTPQWPNTVPVQPPRPSAEQSALYANYGYGNQWRQQQQHQQPQQYPHPQPPVQPPPAQATYNPYQPNMGPYPGQPYSAQPPAPSVQQSYQAPPQPYIPRAPYQQQPPHPPQQPFQQPPQHTHQHQPGPPAKRPRFESGGAQQLQQQQQQQPQPQQRGNQLGPHQSFSGAGQPMRGGGGLRGGSSGRGSGVQNNNRLGRGGSMSSGNRGGMAGNRGGRGGYPSGGGAGRGGSNALRGHNSRGNFAGNANRRNAGSFSTASVNSSSSFNTGGTGGGGGGYRGRAQNRSRHDGGNLSRQGTAGSLSKRDENRRTLTDFKLIGLEIPELAWTWGTLPSSTTSPQAIKEEIQEDHDLDQSTQPVDEPESNTANDSVSTITSSISQKGKSNSNPPPSRLRIYFHTPVSADDARPIPHSGSYGVQNGVLSTPQGTRKGKRKKIADEDEDAADDEEGMGRGRPKPREGSVAASVAETVATVASEADWLMAAIEEGAAEDRDEDFMTAHEESQPQEEVEGHINGGSGSVEEFPFHLLDASCLGTSSVNGSVLTCPPGFVSQGLEHEIVPTQDSHEQPSGEIIKKDERELSPSTELAESESSVPGLALHPENEAEPGVSSSEGAVILDGADGVSHIVHEDADVSSQTALDDEPVTDVHKSPGAQVTPPSQTGDANGEHTTEHNEGEHLPGHTEHLQDEEEANLFSHEHDQEHLPEPPNSSASNTPNTHHSVTSTPFNFNFGGETLPSVGDTNDFFNTVSNIIANATGETSPVVAPNSEPSAKLASANRLSISYAGGNRRLVIDAEVADTLKVYRKEGRVEVALRIAQEGENSLKGIQVEILSQTSRTYSALNSILSESDSLLPPFGKLSLPASATLSVYLDTEKPLSEPKWVKSGDVQDWLRSMFGGRFWAAGDAADGWERKIVVVDPDPPPTIWTLLDGWAANSPVGVAADRHRFLKTHMTETDNILEILLRLVRGERATPFLQSAPPLSTPSVSGPLLSALSQSSAHATQQSHVSLAVLAIFRMATEFAVKSEGDKGKAEVEERVGEIIRCLPSHLLYKSLDGIFKEWRADKKGR